MVCEYWLRRSVKELLVRWIFLTLLLLNLLVFGLQWADSGRTSGAPMQAPASTNVERLVLLREATPAQLARTPAARVEAPRSAKPASTAASGADQLCLVVGPVDTESAAQQIRSEEHT